jgi:hypothetical protein
MVALLLLLLRLAVLLLLLLVEQELLELSIHIGGVPRGGIDDLESAKSGVAALIHSRRRYIGGGIVVPCDWEGTTANAAGHTPS